jgi:hypothetical protein
MVFETSFAEEELYIDLSAVVNFDWLFSIDLLSKMSVFVS